MSEVQGLVEPIPTNPDTPYPLGRAMVHHDPRNFLFRALDTPDRAARPYNVPWYSNDVYNQIDSDCTMNAAVGVYRTSPHREASKAWFADYDTAEERVAGYQASKEFDPWPGTDYDGTSTDAPFRLLRDRGLIPKWQWLFGFDEMVEWLKRYGPVSIGTNWYDQMFEPDDKDRIIIGGSLAGGHAYRSLFWSPRYGTRIVNSWDRTWGRNGRAWIPDEIMRQLLSEMGEVVTV